MSKEIEKQTEQSPARGNLVGFMSNYIAELLTAGTKGQATEAREAHRTLAAHILDSNIAEPYRAWLVWMHSSMADGMDARIACALKANGRQGKFEMHLAIYNAILDIASEQRISWGEAATKLHGNTATAKRFGLKGKLPKLETLKNIYRKMWKAHHPDDST